MSIELCCCTDTLLEEIARHENTRDDVAVTYALAIMSSESTAWDVVNNAILARWSRNALDYIKSRAWARAECETRRWLDDGQDMM